MSRHEQPNYPVDLTATGYEVWKENGWIGSIKRRSRDESLENGAYPALPDYRALISNPQSNTS